MSVVSNRTRQLVAKLDEKAIAIQGFSSPTISQWLNALVERGSVEVGYRAQCGSTHSTQRIFREWLRVLKSLERDGVRVEAVPIKHKNAYATNNGGFWHSAVYSVAKAEGRSSC